MTSDADLVELKTAHSIFEAEHLVGALKGYDIEAVTFGGSLADEFAMSRKAMGAAGGVSVMVRRDDLARAKAALAEIEAARDDGES